MEKLLAELIAMPTISDDITANDMALDYVESYLKKRGMHCQRDRFEGRSTLLASSRLDNLMSPRVLLVAHIDVVAGDEGQFTLRQDDDRLYGRGVYDMKFAIAGYMQLVDDLQANLADYDFGILIVTDEETIDVGVKNHIRNGLRPQICILPDSAAPNWDIETTAKGYWRFDLIARGKAAHGGRPWEGESASFKLLQALHELKTHFVGQNVNSDSLNIGQIYGGKAHNMVPSEMIAGLDIRFLNEQSLREKKAILRSICVEYNVTLREITVAQPVLTDLEHPLVKAYLDSVDVVTGRRPKSFISCAGTDAPYFQEVGVYCIISCCEGGGHHTEAEWVGRKSFLQFLPILHDYVERVARVSMTEKRPSFPRKTSVAAA